MNFQAIEIFYCSVVRCDRDLPWDAFPGPLPRLRQEQQQVQQLQQQPQHQQTTILMWKL